MRRTTLNNLLLVSIIAVNLYIILTPLLPAALFAAGSRGGRERQLAAQIARSPAESSPTPVKPQPNGIIIPSMLLDQPVYDSRDIYAALNKGILHLPGSSTPDKGGNTVLLGHRFTYSVPKGVFYYLDKLKVGDELALTWSNKQYRYRVREVRVVLPTETAIQAPTTDAKLTLFTCTPLLWPKDRLVVIAVPEHS
jgi:LPXTG-site transpeptidase (sortase) family protein